MMFHSLSVDTKIEIPYNFPLMSHSGCTCWMYVLALSAHKVDCVIIHIGETLISTGPSQLLSIIVTQWLYVLGVPSGSVCPQSGLCDNPYRGNPY